MNYETGNKVRGWAQSDMPGLFLNTHSNLLIVDVEDHAAPMIFVVHHLNHERLLLGVEIGAEPEPKLSEWLRDTGLELFEEFYIRLDFLQRLVYWFETRFLTKLLSFIHFFFWLRSVF